MYENLSFFLIASHSFAGKYEFMAEDCKIFPLAINQLKSFPIFSHVITWFHQTYTFVA